MWVGVCGEGLINLSDNFVFTNQAENILNNKFDQFISYIKTTQYIIWPYSIWNRLLSRNKDKQLQICITIITYTILNKKERIY